MVDVGGPSVVGVGNVGPHSLDITSSPKQNMLVQVSASALVDVSEAILTQSNTEEKENEEKSDTQIFHVSQNLNHNKKQSYANTADRSILRTFKQSVILKAIDGFTNDQYMDEFEKLMNIKKLSCFFFPRIKARSKTVTVKNQVLEFTPFLPRRTVHQYKRIVISNILSQIPNDIVVDQLKSLNITIRNGITNIRCSTSNDARKHVISNRRQFYVKKDFDRIPNKMKINFQNVQYWIFLGADDIKCHFFKNPGHIAKYCPELNKDLHQAPSSVQGPVTQIQNVVTDSSLNLNVEEDRKMDFEVSKEAITSLKRSAPPSLGD